MYADNAMPHIPASKQPYDWTEPEDAHLEATPGSLKFAQDSSAESLGNQVVT